MLPLQNHNNRNAPVIRSRKAMNSLANMRHDMLKLGLTERDISYQFARKKFSEDHEYTFRYERKEGIHHMFREIHGGWSRTYTDAQLVGKNIMEVQSAIIEKQPAGSKNLGIRKFVREHLWQIKAVRDKGYSWGQIARGVSPRAISVIHSNLPTTRKKERRKNMTKAKPIDRLELTRKKFSKVQDVTPYDGIEDFPDNGIHGDTCPNCGQKTLLHESGCAKCPSCGWSACG